VGAFAALGASEAVLGRIPVSAGVRRGLRIALAAGVLALVFHVAHGEFGLGGKPLNKFAYDVVYDAIMAGAAVSCFVRAWLVRRERLAWLVLGVGLGFTASGEIYYSLVFGDSGNPPIPSFADLLYLLYYPTAFAGLLLLVRSRVRGTPPAMWIDAAIAAMTSAAVIAAIAFETILHGTAGSSTAAILTTLAYPIGDMALLGIAVGMLALSGWRPGRAWVMLAAGLSLAAIADTAYAYANAKGTYIVGGVLDSLWLAGALFTACAPWQPESPVTAGPRDSSRVLVVPAVFALVSLGVLLYGGFHHVDALALALAGGAVLLVVVRAGYLFRENVALLHRSQNEAMTDALTGLGNRRSMQLALDRVMAAGRESAPGMFMMFDLDGFKAYNDRFGHMAGDTMLAHLGNRLRVAVGPDGGVYRPGGDEFCVLLSGAADAEVVIAGAVAALSATGEGFTVTASYGEVEFPSEASTPSEALRLADDRMYARKSGRRSSAGQQTHDALLGLLRERQPELHEHLQNVGELALRVARHLGMDTEQLDVIRRAAELHDIGKAAIPDAILASTGRLNEHEWAFMRRHTLIGERILAAAPALAPVAEIVRSSHERWDGGGYPDGLAGERIPLGARIILVCDAFDAMTHDRPYGERFSSDAALAELRAGSGSQFDPDVVDAFEAVRRPPVPAEGQRPASASVPGGRYAAAPAVAGSSTRRGSSVSRAITSR
jgi:diguanylate cyclase (GGDEF)-like protein